MKDTARHFPPAWLPATAVRTLVFGLFWWILTEGASPLSLWGAGGVAAAVGASLALFPAGAWSWRAGPFIRFLPFFLWQSLLGGLDVAYRALHPGVAVRPEVVRHRFGLRQEPARVFFLWVVSLLPGTASLDLKGDEAYVHVLDHDLGGREKLQDLERRIAELFGENRP